MLALARARLAKPGLGHLAVRQADMYSLPLAQRFDLVVMQMVLHYAEDPEAALAEAARVLVPGGRLVVVDLAAHDRSEVTERLAHRWPGFSDATMANLLRGPGLEPGPDLAVPGPFTVRLWTATMPATAVSPPMLEYAQ
jgi:ArsR family transcriptional regulator